MNHCSFICPLLILLLTASSLLTSCRTVTPFERPLMDMPAASGQEKAPPIRATWWTIFHDPALNKLEQQAIRHNRDLIRAAALVEEASALAAQSSSALYPKAELQASANTQELTKGQQYSQALPDRGRDLWQLSGILSYEVDLWGKLHAGTEAAQAKALSSKAARDAVYLRLTGEVASAYIILRTWEEKCKIIRDVHESYEKTCSMYAKRFEQGQYPELELRRVQAESAKTLAQLKRAENELSRAESALSVLVGDSPKAIMRNHAPYPQHSLLTTAPPSVPSGIPSSLISRRPDIHEQECLLQAAHFSQEAARADRLPSLSLTGALGHISTVLNETLDRPSRMYDAGAGITQTLFDAGAKRNAVKAASARYNAQEAAYEQTVLIAFREVRDALVEREKSVEIHAAASNAVNSIRRSWEIASKQYAAGYIGLMDTLDTHRSLLNYELDLADAAQMRLNAVVKLCKALGGGWRAPSP